MAKRTIHGSRSIVTGASSGIGREIALELARQGGDVIVTARREERLLELVEALTQLGVRAHQVAGDIAEASVRERLLAAAQDQLGGLDILVNNAGIGAIGPFSAASPQRLRHIMEVNFFSAVELTRAALPMMRQGNRPLIANISSVLGHTAVPKKSEYCASKFALHGFSDALREELLHEGIDVLLVSPSTTDSEFFDNVIEQTGDMPAWAKSGMSPAAVARKTVRAIRRGRREVILSAGGKMLVWLDRLAPWLVSRILARYA